MTLVLFGLFALQGGPFVRLVSLLGLGVRIQRTLFFGHITTLKEWLNTPINYSAMHQS